jgi:nascent polypeptide-associated complex subunit alpha
MAVETKQAPVVDVEEDVPELEDAELKVDAGLAGKQAKRYAKAMAKLGLKPEPNIFRVQIRKIKGMSFGISKPEVYRFPNTNTFVIFGETTMDDMGDASRAARVVTAPAEKKAAPVAAAAGAAGEEDQEAGDLAEKDIELVVSQANVTRGRAIFALKKNKGDIVNTIMELTM